MHWHSAGVKWTMAGRYTAWESMGLIKRLETFKVFCNIAYLGPFRGHIILSLGMLPFTEVV